MQQRIDVCVVPPVKERWLALWVRALPSCYITKPSDNTTEDGG